MKKILTVLLTSILAACGTNIANSKNDNTSISSTDIAKMSAVNLYGVVSISKTTTGADTPIEEASDNTKKISHLKLSLYDKDSKKEIETFSLDKKDTRLKGEIFRFEAGFKGIKSGDYNFKLSFQDDKNNIVSEKEKELKIDEKKIYDLESSLEQVSINSDEKAPITTDIILTEKEDTSYEKDHIIISFKKDTEEAKSKELINKMGIKVKDLDKSSLNFYNVTLDNTPLYEALIRASKDENVEYVEPNGIVSIQQKLF